MDMICRLETVYIWDVGLGQLTFAMLIMAPNTNEMFNRG